MAYKDPPKEKYHNGAPCAVIALIMVAAATAVASIPMGWWA